MIEQGSQEWLIQRAGHATASRFADVLAKVRTGEAKSRIDYRWELVTERLSGLPVEQYQSKAMRRGVELEPDARMAYEAETGNLAEQVGFIRGPIEWCGASPDGLIDADGGLEIKCPDNPVIHVQTIHGGMPEEHRAQVQGGMWVTGRQWWDFVSYDPRMPPHLQLYVERIKRDDAYIARLAEEVRTFLAEVQKQHQSLIALRAAA